MLLLASQGLSRSRYEPPAWITPSSSRFPPVTPVLKAGAAAEPRHTELELAVPCGVMWALWVTTPAEWTLWGPCWGPKARLGLRLGGVTVGRAAGGQEDQRSRCGTSLWWWGQPAILGSCLKIHGSAWLPLLGVLWVPSGWGCSQPRCDAVCAVPSAPAGTALVQGGSVSSVPFWWDPHNLPIPKHECADRVSSTFPCSKKNPLLQSKGLMFKWWS